MTTPRLMKRRRLPGPTPYKQVRCALCYRRFWPWQQQIRGANYFRHPWMMVHPHCVFERYPDATIELAGYPLAPRPVKVEDDDRSA